MQPEQQRALAYIRRKGTEAPLPTLRAAVERTFVEIEALLDGIDEATARRRPPGGGWSAQEIVDHLVESHRPATDQLAALLDGRRPEGGAVPAHLQSDDPLALDWRELVHELKAIHRRYAGLLAAAPEDFETDARGPVAMVIKAKEPDGSIATLAWQEELDWKAFALVFKIHTQEHIRQLERALVAIAGRGDGRGPAGSVWGRR